MDADQAVIDRRTNPTGAGQGGARGSVRLVSAAQFAADRELQSAMQDIAAEAAEPNAFAEAWYLAAATELRPGDDLRFAIVGSDTLIGVYPLQQMLAYAGLPIVHLQNWLNPNAFLGAPLVRKGCEDRFWQALLAYLDQNAGQSRFLHLRAMASEGPLMAALQRVCSRERRQIAQVHREERALLEHGLAPDAYLDAALRGKKRKELRRQHNRLAELGDLQVMRGHGGQGLDSWIDEFLTLERRGWKGAKGTALDCNDRTRALFRKALHGADAVDRLDLVALRLDGRAIAMLVNFVTPPGAFSFKTAFAEDYARFSPGVLLQIENLALLQRDDIAWCDSCAAQDHPMIDSIWTGRRAIGRYSVAIGGPFRRAAFAALVGAERAKARLRQIKDDRRRKSQEREA